MVSSSQAAMSIHWTRNVRDGAVWVIPRISLPWKNASMEALHPYSTVTAMEVEEREVEWKVVWIVGLQYSFVVVEKGHHCFHFAMVVVVGWKSSREKIPNPPPKGSAVECIDEIHSTIIPSQFPLFVGGPQTSTQECRQKDSCAPLRFRCTTCRFILHCCCLVNMNAGTT